MSCSLYISAQNCHVCHSFLQTLPSRTESETFRAYIWLQTRPAFLQPEGSQFWRKIGGSACKTCIVGGAQSLRLTLSPPSPSAEPGYRSQSRPPISAIALLLASCLDPTPYPPCTQKVQPSPVVALCIIYILRTYSGRRLRHTLILKLQHIKSFLTMPNIGNLPCQAVHIYMQCCLHAFNPQAAGHAPLAIAVRLASPASIRNSKRINFSHKNSA